MSSRYCFSSGFCRRTLASAPQMRSASSMESARREAMPSRMTRRSMTISMRWGPVPSRVVSVISWISPLRRMRMKPWRWRSPRRRSGSAVSSSGTAARMMSLEPSGWAESSEMISVGPMRVMASPVSVS